MIEGAGTEPVGSFLERTIRRLADDAVDKQSAMLLEGAYCVVEFVVEQIQRDIVPEVLSGASRFEYETEMLIIASRKGHRVASVPITTVYSDEVSSINPVRDTLRFFKLMRRYRKL